MVSTSSEVIGSVDDLLTLILLCLPIKSLMRFKLVSKKWRSLISSPCFYLKYNPGPKLAVGMFYHGPMSSAVGYIHFDVHNPRKPPFRELKFTDDPCPFWIHHSCNGLLLCCSNKDLDYDCYGQRSPLSMFHIYNPTTNFFRKLPRPGVVNGVPRILRGISLAFDPAKSPYVKVVCVRESDFDRNLSQIEIYSAESDEWRLSGEPFKAYVSFHDGVYSNGSMHWINYMDDEVLFFSVDQEKLGKLPLPAPSGRVLRFIYYFGESCDHLHLILGYNTGLNATVFEMKRDHSDWSVKYQVDLTSAVAAAFSEIGYFYPPDIFSLIRSENESPFLVLRIHHKVIRFNLGCNTFEEVYEFGDDADLFQYRGYQYIESLFMF